MKIFAVFNSKLNWCSEELEDHYIWLVSGGILTEKEFDSIVLGHIEEAGVFFYQNGFVTNDYVESIARAYMNEVSRTAPVYCRTSKIRDKVSEISFKHDSCNRKVADECMQAISLYREKKKNTIEDDFYQSHLNCFESLIDDWWLQAETSYAVIMCRTCDLPLYVTFCMRPSWSEDSVLLLSSIYGATKFDLDSSDLYPLLRFVKKLYPDKTFEIITINKGVFGANPTDLWSNPKVRGNFDLTRKINGISIE